MVRNVINLGERENRVINIVKAKYGLKDKSQALSIIIKKYEECTLEPQLKPEFLTEIEETAKTGKFVKVKDFGESICGEEEKLDIMSFAGTLRNEKRTLEELKSKIAKEREAHA